MLSLSIRLLMQDLGTPQMTEVTGSCRGPSAASDPEPDAIRPSPAGLAALMGFAGERDVEDTPICIVVESAGTETDVSMIPSEDPSDVTGTSKPDTSVSIPTSSGASEVEPQAPHVESLPTAPTSAVTGGRRTNWTAGDYVPFITFSGAAKLADSGVAPLVAVARGYATTTMADLKSQAETFSIGDARSSRFKQLKAATERGGDSLILPWYSVTQVIGSRGGEGPLGMPTVQIRPSVPLEDPATGKVRKYEFLQGYPTVLDLHPSTPMDWVRDAPAIMLAEGLLKGDSVLTALLMDAGVTEGELAITPADTQANVTIRLRELLDRVPQRDRVLVVSIAGVANWNSKTAWNDLVLRNKDAYISFDGDVAKNYLVWVQADQLMKHIEAKGARPQLLDMDAAVHSLELSGVQIPNGFGVDDYLAAYGDWATLKNCLTPDLPLKPDKKHEPKPGDFRVHPSGTRVEEFVQIKNEFGELAGAAWEHRVGLGGRIVASEVRRTPTPDELKTGAFDPDQIGVSSDASCTVEVKWREEGEEQNRISLITGPHAILNYEPKDWHRHGAEIPVLLSRHEEWPPKSGADWIRAVKANRKDEIGTHTIWDMMGWVPVEDGLGQAFVIGEQSVARTEEASERTIQGVKEVNLDAASQFGVIDRYTSPGFEDPVERVALRTDLERLIDAFIENSPWRTPEIAATVLAAGVRPIVPRRPHSILYFTGPPMKGKSFTAQCMMSFFAASTGIWGKKLPGSAKDTFTSIESAVSRTPIWVIDDLAPSTDRVQSQREESAIADIVRATANGAGKRRSNVDATARKVSNPRALLVVTAENEHPIPSVRERCAIVEFDGLVSKNVEPMRSFAHDEDTCAAISGALVRMYLDRAETEGWSSIIAGTSVMYEEMIFVAEKVFAELGLQAGQYRRQIEIAADLMLGLQALSELADTVDLEEISTLLYDPDATDSIVHRVARQVAVSHRDKQHAAPGQVLVDCVAQLLVTGAAHLLAAHDFAAAPTLRVAGEDQAQSMHFFGWKNGHNDVPEPVGKNIGYLATNQRTGEQVAFLLDQVAFDLAMRTFPTRIPHGSASKTAWKSAWDARLGLVPENYLNDGHEEEGFKRQYRIGGRKMRLVPISVDALMGNTDDEGDS